MGGAVFEVGCTLIGTRVDDLLAALQRLPELSRSLPFDRATDQMVRRYPVAICDWIACCKRWHATGTSRFQQLPAAASAIDDLLDPGAD